MLIGFHGRQTMCSINVVTDPAGCEIKANIGEIRLKGKCFCRREDEKPEKVLPKT